MRTFFNRIRYDWDWVLITLVSFVVGLFVFIGVLIYRSGSSMPDEITSTEVFDRVFKTEFDGHTYIVFKTNGGMDRYDMSGVVHDPDCKCFNK